VKNQKNDLRNLYKSIRSRISLERRKAASEACAKKILSLLSHSENILSFASKDVEIDMWPLNKILLGQNRLFLPKIEHDRINIYKISSLENLKLSSFSILEPDPKIHSQAKIFDVDAILIPGLCFDRNNHRLGYGKGHYDMLLCDAQKKNPKLKLLGVGFIEQISNDSLPFEEHDVQLDQILVF
jgi:5-formyltetrahydrofolate cyclo-ligase